MSEMETKDSDTIVTVLDGGAVTPASLPPLNRCPTNLIITDPIEKAWLINGCSPGDYEIEPGKPLQFVATRYLVLPDSMVDEETGEVRDFARVVLYDIRGHTFRTTGIAAPMQIYRIAQVYTKAEWDEGIPLVITCRPSKRHKGATYHDIKIDIS